MIDMAMSDLTPEEMGAAEVESEVETEVIETRSESEFAVHAQPGVTVLNGAEQTPFLITNRHTGETVSFGRKLAERGLPGLQMWLTCDQENEVFWILILVEATGVMFQNGYLVENAEGALQIFIGGTEEQIRAELLIDPPPAS